MNEAVNYIKHLEKNIKELSAKRDELKKLSNNSSNPENHESESEQYTPSNSFFSVRELNDNGGVGIEVSSGFREERLRLSKLLELVLEEGLGVVTCVSSQVNGRLIHCVQCEVWELKDNCGSSLLYILLYSTILLQLSDLIRRLTIPRG